MAQGQESQEALMTAKNRKAKTVAKWSPQDEEALAHALHESQSPHSAAALHAMMPGIRQTPKIAGPEAWMALAAPRPTPKLRGILRRLYKAEPEPPPFAPPAPHEQQARLQALRANMQAKEWDALLIPVAGAHPGEYLTPAEQRLAWLSGFTGSAGMAVILAQQACVFVDGRYTLQAAQELDSKVYEVASLEDFHRWLKKRVSGTLAFDPLLHTQAEIARLRRCLREENRQLVPAAVNPIDEIRTAPPPPPLAPIWFLSSAAASILGKRQNIAQQVKHKGADVLLLAHLESIAWLLNWRGGDLAHLPCPLAYALLFGDGQVSCFLDPRKLPSQENPNLEGVQINPIEDFYQALGQLKGKKVLCDPKYTPEGIACHLKASDALLVAAPDPCLAAKAIKTPSEIAEARRSHKRDAIAVISFLCWLEQSLQRGVLMSEEEAAAHLLAFRRRNRKFLGPSFETICAQGAHAAIVHYRPSGGHRLAPHGLLLLDSGGHYRNGTTDITRTIALGPCSQAQKHTYTQVLKAFIALATSRFPQGTQGIQLDACARQPLWQVGADYQHGTGHGVGHLLGVHEDPPRLSKNAPANPLRPGMILSLEPGLYLEGRWGVRIENLAVISEQANGFLCFEQLSLVPIDQRPIVRGLLTHAECQWLNRYHETVRKRLHKGLPPKEAAWLTRATRPLG